MVKELQGTAFNVFLVTSQRQIRLNISWLPRDQNSQAGFLSKIVDFDDYSLHDEVFHLDNLWGPHSVDRFACSCNAKLPRFNSRLVQDGPELLTPSQGTGHLRITGWCHQYLSLARH